VNFFHFKKLILKNACITLVSRSIADIKHTAKPLYFLTIGILFYFSADQNISTYKTACDIHLMSVF